MNKYQKMVYRFSICLLMATGAARSAVVGSDNLILNGTVVPSATQETTYQSSSSNRLGTVSDNWNNGLPGQTNTISGTTLNNQAYLDAGDVAYVFSAMPAPLTAYDVLIGDDASGGTLNVQANLPGLNNVEIGGTQNANGSWLQSAGTADAASVLVGHAFGSGSPVFKLSGESFSTRAIW